MTTDSPNSGTSSGPLRDPQFRLFFLGRLVSLLGSSMAPVALAFAVLKSSNSADQLGIVLAARSLPMLVFLLVGGVLADRWSRKAILLTSNLGAAVTQGTVAVLLLTGAYDLTTIATLSFLNGVLTAFTSPALRGIVPQLVDPPRRQRANSLLGSVKTGTTILGPSIAGVVVVAVGGGWAIAVDAASYVAAAFFLARLQLPARVPRKVTSFFHELREGWTAFRSLRWVSTIVIAFAVTNCIYVGVWNVLGPTIALASIGAASWGVVLSVRAVGLLTANAAMYRLPMTWSLPVGLFAYAMGAIPMIVLGLWANIYLLIPAALLAGLGQGVMAIIWETSLQRRVEPTLISRVSSYDDLVSYLAVPLGQITAVPVASLFGQTSVMVAGGVLFGIVAILPVVVKTVRRPVDTAQEPSAEQPA
ncbi:MFS transporter [Kutzneria sp. NPDC051319]|uniref:MFS transporter n=1 Tax=Kutzneria sp. NPDC051319 TaxID=3155047 RepID=UPI003446ABD0